jgi:hypothetical protein
MTPVGRRKKRPRDRQNGRWLDAYAAAFADLRGPLDLAFAKRAFALAHCEMIRLCVWPASFPRLSDGGGLFIASPDRLRHCHS